jgi:NADP-dependent 3-hydroxy acid dehydrogenase YdfG
MINQGLSETHCARPEPLRLTDLKDQTVMVTGATSGIGEACAWRFAEVGAGKVVIVGRKVAKLQEMKKEIESATDAKVAVAVLDVRDKEGCMKVTEQLPKEFRNIDVLVNNAGLALGVATVATNSLDDISVTMETNVVGVLTLCRSIVPGMIERSRGHIINIGSIAGHMPYANGTIYNASKFAVLGMTSATRMDLIDTPIRVTHIAPGMVGGTDFSITRFGGHEADGAASKAAKVYDSIVPLSAADVADNVVYVATRPAHAQVTEITMLATNQTGPKDIARVGPSLGAKKQL